MALIAILCSIFGLILGGIGIYLICRPKIKHTIKQNTQTLQENEKIKLDNQQLINVNQTLQVEKEQLKENMSKVQSEYDTISARKEEIKNSLNDLEKQSTEAAEKFYESARQLAQASFDQEIDNMYSLLQKNREYAKKKYLETTEECMENFQKEIQNKQEELEKISIELKKEKQNVDIAVEAAKRRQQMEDQQDFYRLNLSEEDITEIKRLREVLPYLRDKTSLNKVIYKVYYEKPLTDMIGRVVGTGQHTGIYKITHIPSEKCYVGQAVNIGR